MSICLLRGNKGKRRIRRIVQKNQMCQMAHIAILIIEQLMAKTILLLILTTNPTIQQHILQTLTPLHQLITQPNNNNSNQTQHHHQTQPHHNNNNQLIRLSSPLFLNHNTSSPPNTHP